MGHIRRLCGLYLRHLPMHTCSLVPSWGNRVVTMGDRYDVLLASNIKALEPFLLFPWGQISTPPAGMYEVAHLHISIQGGSLQVSEQKKVLVKALELGTLSTRMSTSLDKLVRGGSCWKSSQALGMGSPGLGPRP